MKAVETVSRVTPGGLLCRGLTFGFTLAALLLAVPAWALDMRIVGFVAVAAGLVAGFPGTRVVSLVLLGAVAGWVISLLGGTEGMTLWKLIGFASSLYLAHSSAALAAVVPFDAVLAPEVLARWYVRSLGVVGITAIAALMLLVGAATVSEWPTSWIASVLGILAVLGGIVLFFRLYRR